MRQPSIGRREVVERVSIAAGKYRLPRHFLKRSAALSLSGAASAASTFFVFALVARRGSSGVVGQFALALALSQAVLQVIDAGYGPIVVRRASEPGDAPVAVLKALLARRVPLLLAAQASVALLLLTISWKWDALLTCELAVFLSAVWGYIVLCCQALRRFKLLAGLQFVNAAAYVVCGWEVLGAARSASLSRALAAPSAALLVVDAVGLVLLRHVVLARAGELEGGRGPRHLLCAVLANTVTGNADLWALAWLAPSLVGGYAINQRPALLIGIVSSAIATVVLPTVAREANDRLYRQVLSLSASALALIPLFAGGAYLAAQLALPAVYGHHGSIRPGVCATVVAAYSLGLLTVGPSACLVKMRKTGVLAGGAVLQMIATGAGVLVAAHESSVEGVALALVLGRLVVLFVQSAGLRQGLRERIGSPRAIPA